MFKKFILPFVVFTIIGVFLGLGLSRDPSVIPSPLVGKPAPQFSLPTLESDAAVSPEDMRGKVWLLNVWASWCVACLDEHPILLEMARNHDYPIVGLNYEDAPQDARNWLIKHGNPYDIIAVDREGNTGIDYGVYGVPETFVVDSDGNIRHKVIGAIKRDHLESELLPLLDKLGAKVQ